jgi:hypothetical protein
MVINFLLNKKSSPTPYSSISYFKKKKKTPHTYVHSSFLIIIWNCYKPLITLPHLNIPYVTFKNWNYRTWLCRYGSQCSYHNVIIYNKLKIWNDYIFSFYLKSNIMFGMGNKTYCSDLNYIKSKPWNFMW